ncbi:MAG: cytochrome c maturation protein CcmE [Selenomonadaceae bacterium]|nr:cytochrome c maturation protein CcmE [Selenomonadaceae bacterium]
MRKIFLVILLLGFIGYAGINLAESVTPYVSIAEAQSNGGGVQVKGLLDKNSPTQQTCDEFSFTLQDEATGETMRVKYEGIKPDRFDEAYHIVAVGNYHSDDNSFHAKKLLIKCPSKYEGQQPQS